jgi:peptidoglycan/LPS O-acetylase OafA/YrhL
LSDLEETPVDSRLLPSGREAGTAPGDRRFRPDVEGLRAIAILTVVLFHAGVPGLTGGYVGVDVFFVISGFVITGVLLRERQSTGGTSVLDFYARRVRRILPAASLVIVVVAVLSYLLLGYATGTSVADDGRWASVFLVNFHFTAIGTNYLSSQLPPSPLQNFWSLSVEEQFYVVFPTFIIVAAAVRRSVPLRTRLSVMLVGAIVVSYAWSIIQTGGNPTAAYFSPFTRAWELALGALIAVGTSWLRRVPSTAAAAMTWVGLGAIMVAAFAFDSSTPYPGSLVAIPVVGAGMVIAGGVGIPRLGTERLIGLPPFRWLGKVSYSLYLWHWPILILAAEHVGKTTLSLSSNLVLVGVALAISVGTYFVIENPIRQARLPSLVSVTLGVVLIAVTLALMTLAIHQDTSLNYPKFPIVPADEQTILRQVAVAPDVKVLPRVLQPPVAHAESDRGSSGYVGCIPSGDVSTEPVNEPSCTIGDPGGSHEMVVYGDSHATMWLPAFDSIAKSAHMKLVILSKPGCPVDMLKFSTPAGLGLPAGSPFVACARWHQWALDWIAKSKPSVLVLTQNAVMPGFSPGQWETGLTRLLHDVHAPDRRTVVLGNIPILPQPGPSCLALHPNDVQACSGPLVTAFTPYNRAERASALANHVPYVDPTPWFCSSVCTAVIGHYEVYSDGTHITAAYAQYLTKVLAESLHQSVIVPSVVLPNDGATVSGNVLLDTVVSDSSNLKHVVFQATGPSLHNEIIGIATPKVYGWVVSWDSTKVANGYYLVRSVVVRSDGTRIFSSPILIRVKNKPGAS